jgi:hypothetical protein
VLLKINFAILPPRSHLTFKFPPIYEKISKRELRDSGTRRKAKVPVLDKQGPKEASASAPIPQGTANAANGGSNYQ